MPNFAMPVRLYMGTDVQTLAPNDSLNAAKDMMIRHRISSLPVVDDAGALVGLISRSDLLRVGRREAASRPEARLLVLPTRAVSEVMSTDVVTVGPDAPMQEAAAKMIESRIHRVIVMDDRDIVGVISPQDIVSAIAEKRLNVPLSDHMSTPVFTVRASEPLSTATDRLAKARISGLIVLDGDWPVGAFTQVEALRSKDDIRVTPVEEAMSSAILRLDHRLPMHRAAAQAVAMDARRVVVSDGDKLVGILSGLDFARAIV